MTPLFKIPTQRLIPNRLQYSHEQQKHLQKISEKPAYNQDKIQQMRNNVTLKLVARPENQYDLPPTRGHNEWGFG